MKKIFRVCIALLLCFSLVTPAFALDGIWHNPYGIDDLYDHEPTEIYPLTPIAGEMIYIKSTTWPVEAGQSVWLTYTKNGEPQPDIGAEWKYNSGNNSYWEAAIGPFEKGDVIEYTVFADKDGQNTQSIGPFSFHVVEWERAQSVELGSQEDGLVVLNVTSDQGDSTPKLGLSFPSADVLRFQFSPLGDVAFEAGAADYSIEEDSICRPPVLWSKGNVKRLPELDRLVQSAYGDKVMGRVPENLCVQLLNGYEVERAAKQERRKVLCELLSARREKEQSVDEWLNMMQDYAQLEEVDRPTLVRLIQTQGKISVQGQICQRTKDFRLCAHWLPQGPGGKMPFADC